MDRESFERLVARAVEQLPDEFLARLHNIDIVVEDYSGPDQAARAGLGRGRTLLGLYEGIPQTRRGQHYGLVPPDKITVFQKAIEAQCRHQDQIAPLIASVVKHEIAHHFGISDARLRQIEES
ncbi:MAG: metallopeptidase family protein [Dehalococcoidales bacterium]|nr:metallopeptidase family protein [Dehalococcoidales bacterium]